MEIGEKDRAENANHELAKQLRKPYISLSVPQVKQETDHTCGPASLKAVFEYYKDQTSEAELVKICGTTPKYGTDYTGMIRAVEAKGFRQESKNGAKIEDIQEKIDAGAPVIVSYMLNNRDETSLPDRLLRNGSKFLPKFKGIREKLVVTHCSVVFGYDDKNLFVLNVATGKPVRYDKKEFIKDWLDDEGKAWMMTVTKF